jgi:LacI family transcriptional regulator/LacI family purine nucleotide synthesis repressor
VPDDLSVIGFDDIPIAAHFRPSLTTVRQEQYTIGVRATEKIIEVINKKKANEIVTCMPLQLIVRDSTKSI